jgi:hypothetical protein
MPELHTRKEKHDFSFSIGWIYNLFLLPTMHLYFWNPYLDYRYISSVISWEDGEISVSSAYKQGPVLFF